MWCVSSSPPHGKLRTMLLGAPGGGGCQAVGTQAQMLCWLVLRKRGQQRARLLPSRAVTLTWTTPVRIRQAQGASLKAWGQCLDIILGGYNPCTVHLELHLYCASGSGLLHEALSRKQEVPPGKCGFCPHRMIERRIPRALCELRGIRQVCSPISVLPGETYAIIAFRGSIAPYWFPGHAPRQATRHRSAVSSPSLPPLMSIKRFTR